MKKCLFICSLLIAANFFAPTNALSLSSFTIQGLSIPAPVVRAANLWACDNGLFPETPLPDHVGAFYTKMNKSTWEVHWFWEKGGVSGEARLLITNGGKLLNVY